MTVTDVSTYIRDIADFPEPGIVFKDITPLLASAEAFNKSVNQLMAPFVDAGITKVAGIEARGFIFAGPIATRLGAGFVPIRKPGKLPHEVSRFDYVLEYGTDALEVHIDAFSPADRVLIVDDVLATGGTAAAAIKLVSDLGARVSGLSVLIELDFLGGREKIGDTTLHSLISYGAD